VIGVAIRQSDKMNRTNKSLMTILSNQYFFPLLQLALLSLLLFAVWDDYRPLTPGGVMPGDESMSMLQRAVGLVIAAIVTIINKSVFDDDDADWQHYSAFINAADLGAIVYLCYVSPWGRNHIIGLKRR
jgi:hypothetical protein